MSNNIIRLLSTFFYVGLMPLAPGTLASFAGLLLYAILSQCLAVYFLTLAFIAVLGFFVSDKMEKILTTKDPGCVVIDEVAGMLIALFMLPLNFPVLITAFFLFRAFDMFKIYPANRLEDLHGGAGIMMDDIVGGIYTNVIMHLALRLGHFVS